MPIDAAVLDYTFHVNSFEVCARYYQEDRDEIFLPLLKIFRHRQKEKGGRLVVFLAAPPGVGKTTLSLFLEYLAGKEKGLALVQSVGLDGFHYPQEHIQNHFVSIDGERVPMKQVKGCPETFDLERVTEKLRQLQDGNVTWPVYDRSTHDVVEDAILITREIVLVEGNWLLLDELGWRELKALSDYSIFIQAEEAMLKERLIQRKMMGGLTREAAEKFYERSDGRNVQRVLNRRMSSDMNLQLLDSGKYLLKG